MYQLNDMEKKITKKYSDRYYIIPIADLTAEMFKVFVQTEKSYRRNLAKSEGVFKLHDGDINAYKFLAPYTEYSYTQILDQMQLPTWTDYGSVPE